MRENSALAWLHKNIYIFFFFKFASRHELGFFSPPWNVSTFSLKNSSLSKIIVLGPWELPFAFTKQKFHAQGKWNVYPISPLLPGIPDPRWVYCVALEGWAAAQGTLMGSRRVKPRQSQRVQHSGCCHRGQSLDGTLRGR